MKIKFVTLLFMILISCSAQTKKGEIILDKNISLLWETEKFEIEEHSLESCKTKAGKKFICTIDKNLWYGSDMGTEIPRNILIKLALKINSEIINLNVSTMFNPSFDGTLSKKQFLLKKESPFYRLYGFFSDGAGSYTAHWKIANTSSIREVISNDEDYFSWQNE